MGVSVWLPILLTTVAAIASVLAAMWTGAQSLAVGEQVRIAEQARKDQAQPYVFADLRPKAGSPFMVLWIENTGATVARNVRVRFDPPLQSRLGREIQDLPVLTSGLAALPPGRHLFWMFDVVSSVLGPNSPNHYHVIIEANGPFGPVDRLEYDIDLTHFDGAGLEDSNGVSDITRELENISYGVRALAPERYRFGVRSGTSRPPDPPAPVPKAEREHSESEFDPSSDK